MRTIVKTGLLLLALLVYGGSLLHSSRAGMRTEDKQGRKEPESISPRQLAQAKTLFNERCARCHGTDGRGETVIGYMLSIPNFTDEKWWTEEKSDKRFIASITHGKGEMPAFGKKFSRQEISALTAYVRRFNKASR